MATLRTKNGFDFRLIAWGKPDMPQRELCSYCHSRIEKHELPLEIYKADGSGARFCDACIKQYFDC